MTSLALALALASQQPQAPAPAWYRPWRLVETPTLHVGLRPAAYADVVDGQVQEIAAGFTLQVTTNW